jgi:HlyD family secretion protein
MAGKKKRNVVRWIVGIIVIIVIIGGSVYSKMSKAMPVQTAQAAKGKIRAYVEERARTTLPHVYHLTMPEQGRILPITLKAGAPVKQGQVVAEMDAADLKDALKEANEMVSAMKNAVDASQATIAANQARMDYAKWLWDAKKKLYADEKTSEMEEKVAQKDYIESKVDHEESQSIFYAMGAIQAAVKLMPIYVNRRLKRTAITSPINGVVLKRYVWNEKVLNAGEHLLDIGNLDELQITSDILSEQVVKIKEGQPVDIFGETIGDDPISGKVTRVKPQGFTKVSSLGVEQQRVGVVVDFTDAARQALDQQGRELGLAYRVRVRVYTDEADRALIIPRTCLFRGEDGSWQVYVVRNSKAQEVQVDVGLTNDKEAQILKGLAEGDTVIVAPEASLTSGTRVNADT